MAKDVIVKRNVMTPRKLKKLLVKTCKKRLPVMVSGMPGVGKTDIAHWVAKKLNCNIQVLHPVVSDPTDAKGMPWIYVDESTGKPKAVFIPFGELEAMINAKGLTIVLLDDLGQAPPCVQAAFMQLILSREINGKRISDDVVFIACTNRKEDRAGVSGILEPVKSRFVCIVELTSDLESWCEWAIDFGIEPEVIAFVRWRPWVLQGGENGFEPTSDMTNSPVGRTVKHLDDLVKLNLDADLKMGAFSGAVGDGAATEYIGFERILKNLPDVDKILRDPTNADAPANNDVQYALVGVFHRRMTKTNLDNIYKYVTLHFKREMQAIFHFDVEKYNSSLVKTKGYVDWSVANGEAMTG
jgi:hypothetical protein